MVVSRYWEKKGINQGLPKKQNQQDEYIEKEIDYKKLAYATVEAGTSKYVVQAQQTRDLGK